MARAARHRLPGGVSGPPPRPRRSRPDRAAPPSRDFTHRGRHRIEEPDGCTLIMPLGGPRPPVGVTHARPEDGPTTNEGGRATRRPGAMATPRPAAHRQLGAATPAPRPDQARGDPARDRATDRG